MRAIRGDWRLLGIMAGAVLPLAGLALAQGTSEKSLVVNGKTVRGAIVEMQGRTYVDIRMLGQAMGATVAIEPDKITFATSAPAAGNGTQAGQQEAATAAGRLSTNFRAATIAALSDMRQWQGAMESVVASGMQVNGNWPQDYRDHAEASVNLAKVRVLTADDQSALQLLENEFATLRDWSEKVVADRKNLNAARFVDPNALKNDVVLTKITECSRFMGSMISGGSYADSASCH